MARFISRIANYTHGVQSEVSEPFANGTKRVLVKFIEAKFDTRDVTDEDHKAAVATLRFPGLPEDKDTRRDVDPRSRLSVFDSEAAAKQNGWTEEEHDLVVKTLRESDRAGLDHFEFVPAPATLPWPSYDSTPVEALAMVIEATGVSLDDVLAYERENQNRDEVIAEVEGLLEDVEQEIVVQA